jgi:hypothetical protein
MLITLNFNISLNSSGNGFSIHVGEVKESEMILTISVFKMGVSPPCDIAIIIIPVGVCSNARWSDKIIEYCFIKF